MTKSELIEALSSELNLTSRKTTDIVNTILDSMTDELVNVGNVEIRRFGSFTVREYESYEAKNPKTGEKVYVKAKKLPFFKVGKSLREDVNNGSNPK
jgi:integration host factor subunit beta